MERDLRELLGRNVHDLLSVVLSQAFYRELRRRYKLGCEAFLLLMLLLCFLEDVYQHRLLLLNICLCLHLLEDALDHIRLLGLGRRLFQLYIRYRLQRRNIVRVGVDNILGLFMNLFRADQISR